MDKMLYIAMSGAKENFNGISVHGNNLANASTTGFKADLGQARAMNVYGEGLQSRAFSMTERAGYNLDLGTVMTTGRALDVCVKGDGFIAVKGTDAQEGYTRNGSLQIDTDGVLRNSSGLAVLSPEGEEIVLPMPLEKIQINKDGVISGRPEGAGPEVIEEFGQIKLVKIDPKTLVKGSDGLFRSSLTRNNIYNNVPQDPEVELLGGVLESSNVNVVEEMTSLIRLQRQFDMQLKLMETAKDIDESQTSLLRLS
ncbi:MAG: flagellar basal body rod protein FlgF [Succinivibrionaceae bacterium]|nr:flagellar basal body rod protein FlgF [Succinivibrionaceae bacterium]